MKLIKLLIICIAIAMSDGRSYKNPHFTLGRSVIVHLFEWKWKDIAMECEQFLGRNAYAGVQVSPVTENVIIPGRPWFERYQPISYKLITRSGNGEDFADMVARCNAAGVRTYVDVVINHMAAIHQTNTGTGGSVANPLKRSYPDVGFIEAHFNNPVCGISNYNNSDEVRNCELKGLRDLNQAVPFVHEKIVEFLNHLIDLGVAGFRFDAAKHMRPRDLKAIYDSLKPLNLAHGFKNGALPYIVQEVIDLGGEPISRDEYTPLGAITEFRFSKDIGRVFRGHVQMCYLHNWGTGWGFVEDPNALVFVDNHDNQRGHGPGGDTILVYRDGRNYRMATAWALAHPYGNVRIMSSFEFPKGANSQGPPHDVNDNILSPSILPDGSCGNGWVCEHRWKTTANMVSFRIAAGDAPISRWYDNQSSHVAFSRGNRAFIAFNHQDSHMNMLINTTLPHGVYCDIISGKRDDTRCTGLYVSVNEIGDAHISILPNSPEGVIAIHVGPLSKLV